jgi:hypothetical protein
VEIVKTLSGLVSMTKSQRLTKKGDHCDLSSPYSSMQGCPTGAIAVLSIVFTG